MQPPGLTRLLLSSLSQQSCPRLATLGEETQWVSRTTTTCVSTHDFYEVAPVLIVNMTGWTTLIDWDNTADDETVRSVSISTTEKWRELGEQRGLHLDYLYTNDASKDQSPIATYGAANVDKLKAIALKYDPDQVFQNLQNDGFLLRKI